MVQFPNPWRVVRRDRLKAFLLVAFLLGAIAVYESYQIFDMYIRNKESPKTEIEEITKYGSLPWFVFCSATGIARHVNIARIDSDAQFQPHATKHKQLGGLGSCLAMDLTNQNLTFQKQSEALKWWGFWYRLTFVGSFDQSNDWQDRWYLRVFTSLREPENETDLNYLFGHGFKRAPGSFSQPLFRFEKSVVPTVMEATWFTHPPNSVQYKAIGSGYYEVYDWHTDNFAFELMNDKPTVTQVTVIGIVPRVVFKVAEVGGLISIVSMVFHAVFIKRRRDTDDSDEDEDRLVFLMHAS